MDRRHFIKLCGTTLLLVRSQARAWASEPAAPLQRYARVALVDGEGRPVRAAKLAKDETYVFFYPYAGTPCYLIRLGTLIESENLTTADGRRYDWTGGVGPGRDVVAYSAICSHLMTHPTRAASFINYHAAADELSGRRNVITCCAHGSVFDPARGAKVIAGPAPQPLAAIALEHDPSSDGLFAIGTFGGEQFREFFKDFKRELRDEFGRGQAKQAVDGQAVVVPLAEYSRQRIHC